MWNAAAAIGVKMILVAALLICGEVTVVTVVETQVCYIAQVGLELTTNPPTSTSSVTRLGSQV